MGAALNVCLKQIIERRRPPWVQGTHRAFQRLLRPLRVTFADQRTLRRRARQRASHPLVRITSPGTPGAASRITLYRW